MASNDIAAPVERWKDGQDYAGCPDKWEECNDARLLAAAYAREHDTSPITPELLLADGWVGKWCFSYEKFKIQKYGQVWHFDMPGLNDSLELTTIGQVRSLLRVFGGGK